MSRRCTIQVEEEGINSILITVGYIFQIGPRGQKKNELMLCCDMSRCWSHVILYNV